MLSFTEAKKPLSQVSALTLYKYTHHLSAREEGVKAR